MRNVQIKHEDVAAGVYIGSEGDDKRESLVIVVHGQSPFQAFTVFDRLQRKVRILSLSEFSFTKRVSD